MPANEEYVIFQILQITKYKFTIRAFISSTGQHAKSYLILFMAHQIFKAIFVCLPPPPHWACLTVSIFYCG